MIKIYCGKKKRENETCKLHGLNRDMSDLRFCPAEKNSQTAKDIKLVSETSQTLYLLPPLR